MPLRVLLIAVGGGLGSIARYALGRIWPDGAHRLPQTTLGINLLGAFLLGMLVIAVTETWNAPDWLRPFLGTGILGGFTTFSTFAVQAQQLPVEPALTYLAASIVGGLLLATAGMAVMRRLAPRAIRFFDLDPDLP
ncbi:MAG TPA: CrcB family protein [Jatrophihabitans sp.]|nr:CrcB family protein [Jatrophihabitans sp.]